VERNGTLSNIQMVRGIGAGCDEEALRLIRNMPRFKPGYHRGKKVRAKYTIPVRFRLAEK
jgi:protein TonB